MNRGINPLPEKRIPMRVFRGRCSSPEADHTITSKMMSVASNGSPAIRVWVPPRQVAFGRRDAIHPNFDKAKSIAHEGGYNPIERSAGGRAVAFDGETTIGIAYAFPASDRQIDIPDRYDAVMGPVEQALMSLGVSVHRRDLSETFCPGSDGLVAGGKLAGFAQRITATSVLVGGIVLVDHEPSIHLLSDIYDTLGLPFDQSTVGSLRSNEITDDPATIVATIESALVGSADPIIAQIGAER